MRSLCLIACFFMYSLYGQLLPNEIALADRLGYDKNILLLLKSVSKDTLQQLTINKNDSVQKTDGIFISVKRDIPEQFFLKYYKTFRQKGYFLSIDDMEFDDTTSLDGLILIKTRDKFKILQLKQTNGLNVHGISTKAIIKRFKYWEKIYGFNITIMSAGSFHAYLHLDKIPQNVDRFLKEVYEFCPDLFYSYPMHLRKKYATTTKDGFADFYFAHIKKCLRETGIICLWWEYLS